MFIIVAGSCIVSHYAVPGKYWCKCVSDAVGKLSIFFLLSF